ncbi:MAG: MASE1 domain-containing protein [Gemmatimonadaceae bacterium]|nr:MASE1 domain-containing protein [Gemmatimonadaceae bacterium]
MLTASSETAAETRESQPRSTTWELGAVALYLLVTVASIALPQRFGLVVASWPPSGVALAILLLSPRAAWPRLLTMLFVADVAAQEVGTLGVAVHAAFTTIKMIEVWIGAALMRRFAPPRPGLTSLHCVLVFLAVTFFAAMPVSATLGGVLLFAWRGVPLYPTAVTWWLGNSIGVITVGGCILALAAEPRRGAISWTRRLELLVLFATFGVALAIVFNPMPGDAFAPRPNSFLLFPFFVWAAARFGPAAAASAVLIVAMVATIATQMGHGAFAMIGEPSAALLWVQLFVIWNAVSSHLMAAALAERGASLRLHRVALAQVNGIIEGSTELIWAFDADRRLIAANSAWLDEWERLSGVRPRLGVRLSELRGRIPEEQLEDTELLQARAIGGEPFTIVRTVGALGGHRRDYEVSYAPLRADDGAVAGGSVIVRDITERDERVAAHEQAKRMESLGQLAGGVAHDFNNLMTAVLGYGQLLERSIGPEDPRQGDVQQILRAARRAGELTHQLLAFARKQFVEPRVFDLDEQLAQTASLLARLIPEHVRFTLQRNHELWPVRLDPAQFENVIVNLVVNARDAMPEGGELRITTANVTLDQAFVTAHRGARVGEYVRVQVIDEGTGMTEEVRARALEPFFTTKPQGKGTGLGLSTVYGIVSQADGFVAIQSALGAGTTMEVYLPRSTGALTRSVPPAGLPPVVPPRAQRVLVVEDDPILLELARAVLERAGFAVATAADADHALAEAGRGAIHALVIDVMLPGRSGVAVARALQGHDPTLPVLFISGYSADAMPPGITLPEGAPFLEKPFSGDQLLARVEAIVAGPAR